jgi:hypothetical protein
MWILKLNPMQGHSEELRIVARAETKERLEEFLQREQVEPYIDDGTNFFFEGPYSWHKVFRKGGPLEWYNYPDIPDYPFFENVGTIEDVILSAELRWNQFCSEIMEV